MPKYRVTAPDGKTVEVTAPEGASQADVLAYVKANWKPAAPAETYDPTEGMSGLDKFLAGTGKAFVDLGRGAGDLWADVAGGDSAARDAATAEARRLDAPLMATGAGMAGNLAGNVLATALPMAIPGVGAALGTVRGAGALGAGLGALQATTDDESRLANMAIGGAAGAAGQGVANAFGRLVRPVRSTLPPPAAGLAAEAEKAGIPLNAAQATGSKPLQVIDSVLDKLPFTADAQAAAKEGQRAAWRRGLLAMTGENADEATPAVLGAVKQRISGEFERLASAYDMPVTDDLLGKLAAVETEYGKRLPTNQRQIVQSYVDDLTAGPSIPGKTYQDTRSMLTKQVDSLKQSDAMTAEALAKIRDAVDDTMGAHIKATATPDDAKAWTEARKQWKMMRRIEKAADSTTGDISPKKLFNEMTRKDKNAMLYGQGPQDAANLARVGKAFLAEQVPDSGTAQRMFYQNLLTGGGGALGVGTLLGAVPPAAMGAAALGAATPMAMQRALWSKAGQKYLTRGLLKPTRANKMLGEVIRAGLRGGGASLPLLFNASEQ